MVLYGIIYRSYKDELEYKDCTSIEELRAHINKYIHFYNTGDIKEDD
ncbi:IS3 family transposase, partial [Paenibacillus dendritiformis]|nr:IS3 family transposase [Paenibacillus dendritiformis]